MSLGEGIYTRSQLKQNAKGRPAMLTLITTTLALAAVRVLVVHTLYFYLWVHARSSACWGGMALSCSALRCRLWGCWLRGSRRQAWLWALWYPPRSCSWTSSALMMLVGATVPILAYTYLLYCCSPVPTDLGSCMRSEATSMLVTEYLWQPI